jgi:hypothetical protein
MTTLREYGHMFPYGLDELADLLGGGGARLPAVTS